MGGAADRGARPRPGPRPRLRSRPVPAAGWHRLDLDLEALRAARARSELVVRADAHALPFAAGTFDTVLANRMLNAAGGIDQVIREMIRVLRPEGRVVILT